MFNSHEIMCMLSVHLVLVNYPFVTQCHSMGSGNIVDRIWFTQMFTQGWHKWVLHNSLLVHTNVDIQTKNPKATLFTQIFKYNVTSLQHTSIHLQRTYKQHTQWTSSSSKSHYPSSAPVLSFACHHLENPLNHLLLHAPALPNSTDELLWLHYLWAAENTPSRIDNNRKAWKTENETAN